ncbi:MAG TPA: glycosyltransferase [Blastocatellia bacterium]|nr:glycosyltransferase [Blastocatellia bacterium]
MRIFGAVRHSNDPEFFYGGLWSENFYPALRELGHEIIESQTDLFPASRFMAVADNFTHAEINLRTSITEHILDEVRAAQQQGPVHLFLSYFYNSHFDPQGFDELRRLGIPSVNFYCNSIYQFALVSAIAAKVDFSWHAERDARPAYLAIGANPIWVQMGANPEVYHPMPNQRRQPRACFVGQHYADRDRLLAKLVTHSVPVDIYGSGWKSLLSNDQLQKPASQETQEYLGRRIPRPGSLASYSQAISGNIEREGVLTGIGRSFRQARYRHHTRRIDSLLAPSARGVAGNISETFSQYEVILNFSNVWADGRPAAQLIPHVRLRDFEAPMCRTCYLTGYTDEIAEFYELGREIDTYASSDELVDKAKFYLSHPGEAERLREAGYRRALRDHTWKRRFQQLFAALGLQNS